MNFVNVAIIRARGSSKRILGKNFREFCGQPLIAYSIEAAKSCGLFDHVIVSTDDEKIREVANHFGAETPFVRPPSLADDFTPTVPVINHAVKWLQENMGRVDNVCCIYPTAPFIKANALREAYEMLISKKVGGYVFSATQMPFPIQRAFKLNVNGFVEMFEPHNYNRRSQDLEEAYQDAGQFYWGSAEAFNSEKMFFSTDSIAYVLPRYLVHDIDTMEDWHYAELIYNALKRTGEIT